jgi:hypothetical protein
LNWLFQASTPEYPVHWLCSTTTLFASVKQEQRVTKATTPIARHVFPSVENKCAADADNYHHDDVCTTSLITPRPSIGKK